MKYMLVLLLLMGLTACRDKIDSGPHAVHYGEDVCERCRMIISDKRFAAQFITRNGEAKKYDDIGCMIETKSGETRGRPGGICKRLQHRGGSMRERRFIS
jgi:copper chaperone NosL